MSGMTDEQNAALVIKEGVAQLFRPFQYLLERLLGPAATEVGLSFGDSLRVWRLRRQIHLLEKVKKMTDGRNIKTIAPRLFFPILEAASIETDDDMQSRWAALLANEAINSDSVHPSFLEILKQLAPADARLLDKLYDWCISHNTSIVEWWRGSPALETGEDESLGILFRLGLIEPDYELISGEQRTKIWGGHPQTFSEKPKLKDEYLLTNIAFRFVEACRVPTSQAKSATPAA